MSPIVEAIKKIIGLSGFDNVNVYEESLIGGNINCVCLEESCTESFFKILSEDSLEKLPPLILISFSGNDFNIFQHLSKHPSFVGKLKYLQMSDSLVEEIYCAISSITIEAITNPFKGILSLANDLELLKSGSIIELYKEISNIRETQAVGKNKRMKDYHGLSSEESKKRYTSYGC